MKLTIKILLLIYISNISLAVKGSTSNDFSVEENNIFDNAPVEEDNIPDNEPAEENNIHDNTPAEENNISNPPLDFNDAITQEIHNYNNNIASEILGDELENNNKITSKDTALLISEEVSKDLKYALITIVNKITTKNEVFFLETNHSYKYKNITLKAFSCQKSNNGNFEDRVLIKITENDDKNNQHALLFTGWLLAKSSLTSLSHPIYDITLNECTNSKK